jgi:predicted transcriptional regulator
MNNYENNIVFRLPTDLTENIKSIADNRKTSLSSLCPEAVKNYVNSYGEYTTSSDKWRK